MRGDLHELDLSLRQLPGVSFVAFRREGDAVRAVQVVASDPTARDALHEQVRGLLGRHLGETDVQVEVRVAGAPIGPLAIEEALADDDRVREVVAERGPRGELTRLIVTTDDDTPVADLVRRTGRTTFPDRRLGP